MIGRLRNRSTREIRERLAQFAWNEADRIGLVRAPRVPLVGDHAPRTPWAAPDAATVLALLPDRDRDTLLARADSLLQLRFDVLGLRGQFFGSPVNWHADPLSSREAPRTWWTKVPYLDHSVVGDHKVTWEPNRHQWFMTLAQAWVLTGDARYTEHAAAQLRAWLAANPPKVGINWCSALELAFRVQSWIHGLRLAATAPGITPELCEALAQAAAVHARHIERNLSTWFSPNTHITGEALALLAVGTAWPGLSGARRWRERGWRILLHWLPRHVRNDGVYFEQSTWYQAYTVDFYVAAMEWARLAGLTVTDETIDRVRLAAHALRTVARANGTIPLIGDDDGGSFLPLRVAGFGDVGGTLWRAAWCFGDGEIAPSSRSGASTLLWLNGAEAFSRSADLPVSGVCESTALRDGGWAVLRERNAGASHEHMLVFDAGPHGTAPHGHSHADALSIDLTVSGVPLIVDPGTGAYMGARRNHFRSTAAHNTVTIDGEDSSEQGSSFKWKTVASTVLEAFGTSASAQWTAASHDGYLRLPDPVRHRRTILRVAGRYWIMFDDIEAAAPHTVVLTLQLAHGAEVTQDANGLTAVSRDDVRLSVALDPALTSHLELRTVSPAYALEVPAHAIVGTAETTHGAVFCTAFGNPAESGPLRVTRRADARSWLVHHAQGTDIVARPASVEITVGPATFDGQALLLTGPEGSPRIIAAGAGVLQLPGLRVPLRTDDICVVSRTPDGAWSSET